MNWLKQHLKKQKYAQGFQNPAFQYAHLTTIQEAAVIASAIYDNQGPLTIIKENETQARALLTKLNSLFSDIKTTIYHQEDSLRVEAIASSPENHYEKMETLYKLLYEEVDVLITTSASMMRYISDPQYLLSQTKQLKVDQEISISEIEENIINMGYTRVPVVEKPFTFAKRGGLIDVYTIQHQQPIRIDFFDDIIDTIKTFDVSSQRSLDSLDEVRLFVASEYLTTPDQKALITKKVTTRLNKLETELTSDEYDILVENMTKDLDAFILNQVDARFYNLFALCEPTHRLNDLFNSKLIYSPMPVVEKSAQFFYEESVDYLIEQFKALRGLDLYDLFPRFDTLPKGIIFHQFQAENEIKIDIHDLFHTQLDTEPLINQISQKALNERVILTVLPTQMERLKTHLKDLPVYPMTDNFSKPGIYLDNQGLDQGFFFEEAKISVYTSKELFGQVVKRGRYERQFQVAQSLSGIADLKRGDYVVHRQYGVGQYLGLETKEINHSHKDFLKVAYRGGDTLLVPLEQFKLIRKFISSEGVSVRLNKLGSSEWQKTKDRIKNSVNDLADQLIELYKEREARQGFAFSKDHELMKDFEAEFPYTLTKDQEIAIQEVKADMEKPQPMDRLLSGDVGFGKTEVAIRAAFKAILDNKQVVFLCPTTVLSQQHYRTFTERFKNYPVSIGLLNRFVTPENIRKTISAAKRGSVDILIGTHRVLSKDVKFKDLGLLVIDEEQRFGVQQKEAIKILKTSIDVLSLSATPIPRTLQMSLVGIRSLSQLNTPPQNRLPVVTHIVEKNPKLIEDLVEREIARDGQVFYLYNNINEIYNVAYKIQQRFPDITVAAAHGQMDRDEIEDVMMAFVRNEIQVLVCTTIVETGIDIPNANTMIIDQADRFGLAQLYQIKGRVGRSDRLAYAYLLVDPHKQLSEIASKRLEAIKEFTQLGSGYKIAMRDLTIRGAGEILGGQQSGFIDTVGIDLYIELLQEALAIKQNQVITEPSKPLNLDVNTSIPDDYTSQESLKIELYQKIDKAKSMRELSQLVDEMKDRYGDFTSSVELLIEKKQLELLLSDARIEDFRDQNQKVILIFTKDYSDQIDGVKFFETVSKISKEIQLKYFNQQIRLELDKDRGWLSEIVKVLQTIQGGI